MPDIDWQFHEGRDREGERYNHAVLFHASGRIIAKVYQPTDPIEYQYEVAFFVKTNLDEKDKEFRFISLESAQRFAEKVTSDYA
jgi:hypothetical protein